MTEERQNEYVPSRKDIFLEMLAGTREYLRKDIEQTREDFRSTFTRDNFKAKKKSLTDFSYMACGGVLFMNLTPYVIPTLIREGRKKCKNNESSKGQYTLCQNIGGYTGLSLSAIIGVEQISFYYHHPKALAIPLVTNILSGAYELIRPAYNRAKERLVAKKHSQKVIANSGGAR